MFLVEIISHSDKVTGKLLSFEDIPEETDLGEVKKRIKSEIFLISLNNRKIVQYTDSK